MQAIILQIVGLLIITTLIVLFYSKPNIESVETKTYAKLIGLNFLFLVVGISTYIVAKLIGNFNLINILQKTYMSILALLNLYSMFYCISIYDKEEKLSNLKKILLSITIISILLIIALPLNVIFEGDLLDGEGLSYTVALGHTVLSFTFFLIITLYLLIKKYSLKKISPYIILIILYLIGFLIRSCYKELIFEGFFYAYILFIMYNTIENPDVKTTKELAFQKKLAEESSRKTLSLIEDMSEELKSSVKDLELISNTKIDKNNIKELNNVLSSFQENSVKLNDKISSILDLAVVKSEPRIVTYKYETLDMLDKLKQFLEIEKEDKIKLEMKISNKLPLVLYGDEAGIIKVVLYFFDLVSSILSKKNILLEIDDIKVGNFAKLRFKFITNDKSILNYVVEDKKTKKLKLKITNSINYEIINNLLDKMNGNITIIKDKDNINLILSINQRLISEYDIISKKEENRNIKIKYHNYSGKKLLLVDNNNLKLKEMKTLLKPYNIDVTVAQNLEEMGSKLSEDEIFDMIIIDDIIPNFEIDSFAKEIIKDQNGILNYIKKQAKYNIATIIMVTPNNKRIEEQYIKYGFNDYIIKPVNKENIDKILNKYFKAKE
ncbi:MAG TPA: response regulator [Bacilli bacterium]|nr:response regulator [Bacilli bacterium]